MAFPMSQPTVLFAAFCIFSTTYNGVCKQYLFILRGKDVSVMPGRTYRVGLSISFEPVLQLDVQAILSSESYG